jgi:hypothetical protein
MITRRTFFRGAAGSVTALAGVTPLLGGATLVAPVPVPPTDSSPARESSPDIGGASNTDDPQLHLAIFDHRFASGRKFASVSEARGIPTRPITSDVTALWFSELHPLWKEQRVAITGLTTYGPLFCLERLAWDHDMRVLHREQHNVPAGTAVIGGEPNQLLYSWIIAPRQKSSNRES